MASVQNAVRGTAEDKKRRKGILKSKTYGVVIDLAVVFLVNVFPSASLVLFGSTFNSRQFVVHYVVMFPSFLLGGCPLVVAMYSGIIKAKKRRNGKSAFKSTGNTVREKCTVADSQPD